MLQEKFKELQQKIQDNKNIEYTIFLAVAFCFLSIFLTSKLWLPSDVKIQNSAIGSERNVTGGITLVLDSWEYNESKAYMEASFTIHGADETEDIQFTPTAHTNTNKTTPLISKVAYSSSDLLTIQFTNVPKKWQVISLWIKGRDILSGEGSNISLETSDVLEGANFFCDIRKVVINDSLEPQSVLNYALQSIYNQMKSVRADISTLNTKISTANIQINQLNFDISSLKANQKYQTQDEIKQSNSSIDGRSSQIDKLKEDISSAQSQIKNDEEKLKKLNQKLDDTKSGKLSPL